ncbi:MAG TPA: M1 family aminopeptidase [Pyrinomonadaceae bacterium]|jgi:aminopeptidase N|nr:M1 family aminopeptidase [Pyrinomonadaceae bacterium]
MSHTRFFRASVLCLALALTLCAPASVSAQARQRAQTTQGLPPAQYVADHDYDQRHIALDLRFDWEREQAVGTAAISFAPLKSDLRRVEFDAADMTFASVKLADGTPLKYESDVARGKLAVTLDRAYQPSDVVTVVIAYHTNGPVNQPGLPGFGGGLKFFKPTPEVPKRPRQIWSQGETEQNHFWFPCYDHPNDFATTEITATVEKPLTVISNGRLVETRDNRDNTRTFHWKIDEPHATYLTSIVVGDYAAVEGSYAGIPVTSYVYPNEAEEGRVTTKRLPDMVKFFSEATGVKYPYAKYAQTMAEDFGGGMENISATTQTERMIHDARSELDQTADSLESHELAHQWFGDYVTCRSWADSWLNEGFATYFQALWDEHSLGRDDFLYSDVKANQDNYLAAWSRGQRRPVVTKNFNGPDSVFDSYAYQRGAAVLHMLRRQLGDRDWWRAINHYLTKYAHQPVETEQFRIAVEEATGQSMDRFFDQWLYRMGHPVFRVTQEYDPASKALRLTVRQEQKTDPSATYPQVSLFQMPVDVEIGTGGSVRVERVMIEPKEEQTFTFSADAEPQLVNFDYGGTTVKELKFDKTTDALAYQLANDEDVLGRVWALGQLSERAKDKATADADRQRITSALAAALKGDKFWGVRLESAGALKDFAGDAATRVALLAATKDPNARVRARAVASLAMLKDQTLAPVFQQLSNDRSYGVVHAAAVALGETGSPAAYDSLVKLLGEASWHDSVRASGLEGLAALGDRRALDAALGYAADGNAENVRAAAIVLLGAVGGGDQRAFQAVSDALLKSVSPLRFQLAGAAGNALIQLGDQRGVEVFEQARKAAANPRTDAFFGQMEQRLKQKAQQPGEQKPPSQ